MRDKAKEKGANGHLIQIQRRQLGYAFGGPDPSWCSGSKREGILLPVNPSETGSNNAQQQKFTGCFKYSECDLIDDEVRWRAWEDLTETQRESLKRLGCYRATSKWWNPHTTTLDSQRRAGWDPQVIESRRKTKGGAGHWIGNPFGVRTHDLGILANKIRASGGEISEHRDLSPCPAGGCVIPEIERDYKWENREINVDFSTMRACPFFYRHTDSNLAAATPNPQRFTQCYVMLKSVRQELSENGIVAVAPIFRASQHSGSVGEAFWYPFYSGFSFLQLPTWSPTKAGWNDPTLQMRWQATTTARQQTARVFRTLPIQKLFDGVERGDLLVKWETQSRIVSVSEGQASALLLQWVLMNRLEASCANANNIIDIYGELDWCYERQPGRASERGVCSVLRDLGYDVERMFNIRFTEEGAFRRSTLQDDLLLLGLTDATGRPTPRLEATILWLKAICSRATVDKAYDKSLSNDLGSAVLEWLGLEATSVVANSFTAPRKFNRRDLLVVCWLLVKAAASDSLDLPNVRTVSTDSFGRFEVENKQTLLRRLQAYKEGLFSRICRLVPPVHIIVRSNWPTPVRWIFLPIGEASQVAEDERGLLRARVNSGLIILITDDLESSPYKPGMIEQDDQVLTRLWSIRRLISAAARIEEGHVRDELILAKEWWDFQRTSSETVQHLIRTIKAVVEHRAEASSEFVTRVLTNLECLFLIPPQQAAEDKLVPIDVKAIALEAIQAYEALYHDTKNVSFRLLADGSNYSANVRPLVGIYETDDLASIRNRAGSGLLLLLVDILGQRVKKESSVSIALTFTDSKTDRLIIEINIPSAFAESQIWDSDSKPLSFYGWGRGFYSTFFIALALGSNRQQVYNSDRGGVIRIEFPRGQS